MVWVAEHPIPRGPGRMPRRFDSTAPLAKYSSVCSNVWNLPNGELVNGLPKILPLPGLSQRSAAKAEGEGRGEGERIFQLNDPC